MKRAKLFAGLVVTGLVLGLTSPALADGVALPTRSLKSKERASLKTDIAKAKAANPAIFKKVAEAPKLAVERDENKRGRAATIVQPLASLGKDALFPMLEMLAVDAQPRGKMSESSWLTLRTGLIEAVGLIRDQRAKPVLNAILDRDNDPEIIRASAEALARIGDDASAKKLAALALGQSAKRLPVISAIGECRRTVAADALAKLVGTPDEAEAQAVIKSLGTVGNAWAWQTSEISQSGEGDQVRAIASRALMQAFVTYTGYARTKAQTALLIVADPSTPSMIASARQGASPELASALDELAKRFAENPVK
jgi:hypothetical protein